MSTRKGVLWYTDDMSYRSLSKASRGMLTKSLDQAFSQYIRIKNSRMGDAACVTCGVTKPWKELQNGHFYTRGRFPTRWDEMNCHVQCYRCNVLLKGNYIVYTKYMIDRYGREAVDALEVKSLGSTKVSTPTMRENIIYYRQEVKRMAQSGYPDTGFTPSLTIDNTPWGVL